MVMLSLKGLKQTLQIICATLLTSEEVVISNIPDIIDVNKLINLLSSIGVKVKKLIKTNTVLKLKILI